MKNPFIKDNNNTTLFASILLGAIAAGAVSYFYFMRNDKSSKLVENGKEHAKDYLKAKMYKKKKQKTDLRELEHVQPVSLG